MKYPKNSYVLRVVYRIVRNSIIYLENIGSQMSLINCLHVKQQGFYTLGVLIFVYEINRQYDFSQ